MQYNHTLKNISNPDYYEFNYIHNNEFKFLDFLWISSSCILSFIVFILYNIIILRALYILMTIIISIISSVVAIGLCILFEVYTYCRVWYYLLFDYNNDKFKKWYKHYIIWKNIFKDD
jgi:hypothetical protein